MRKFAIPFVVVALSVLGVSADQTTSAVIISSFGVPVTENFNTLLSSGTGTLAANTPAGWGFFESPGNTSYTAGNGGGNSGDTYSFGTTGSTERSLGQLRSGSVVSTLGARFQNSTGGTITSLTISYTGEQWRLGGLGTSRTTAQERFDFQLSTNATSLTAGTYSNVDALDFIPPVTGPTLGALDGNAPANRVPIGSTISGLSIAPGADFYIRWVDVDAAPGADDGLAIDDFALTADGVINPGDGAPAVDSTSPVNNAADVAVGSDIVINFTESVSATTSSFVLDCGSGPATFALSVSPSTTFTLDPADALPLGATCTVTVIAAAIADADGDDPPDNLLANATFSFSTEAPPVNSDIVISQIYGGGGNTGAPWRNDYVELYNRSGATVDVTGWSLQYTSAAGTTWGSNKVPLAGPIGPGEYYLVKLAGGAVGAALPVTENFSGSINISATQGKIALVSSSVALSGNCPAANASVKDFVGYGSAADCSEGTTKAPAPSNTTALFRLGGGATDTNKNGADFNTAAPAPRRTAPIVEVGPVLLVTDPVSGGASVPRDPTIVLEFHEPVEATGSPLFDLACAVSGSHNGHTLAGSGRFLDITINVPLIAGETCTMTVFASGVRDQDLDDSGPNTDTMFANHAWSFTVATGTAPPFPPSVHLSMGNPTGATADLGQPLNYLMEKPEFTLSYNRDLGRPNWVSWHLSSEWFGTLARNDTFRADPQVPPDWYRVQGFDFSGSGFDRGHMVPNADRDKETSIPINQATFLMTNIVAQAPGNNQGPWADMENDLRTIAGTANELFIVSGPDGIGGTGSSGVLTTTLAGGNVTVPSSTWKVVLVLEKADGDDVSRVTCTTRTIAVIMPNTHAIADDDWEDYLTSVDAVEDLTGYDFFSSLPAGVEWCVEAGVNGVNPDPDEAAPAISITSPVDGASYEMNTVLHASFSCADGGSGLVSCDGTLPNGSVIDTSSPGPRTFSVTATDVAGNGATVTVEYHILSAVESLQAMADELRGIISASRPPLSARAATALRKIEDAINELNEAPPDSHHASISISQAMQQIEGLRNQGHLSAAVANSLLARLAGLSW